jgi:MYXO-CTERM domain-containing protein
VPAPEAVAPVTDIAATTTTTQAAPLWPWVLAGIAVIALVGALILRRRRRTAEELYDEEVYVEPAAEAAPASVEPVRAMPVMSPEPQFLRAAPLAAAPIVAATADEVADAVAVEAELAEPEAEDVAALTAGTAPANRPWLEFSMRPVRAGSNAEDALVEIELTVGNSGSIAARDVRISTFMFATETGNEAEMERLLLERGGEGEVSPVTIEPGEGTRVDATLSLSKDYLGEQAKTFVPFVVANARYRLADGSEGYTSASFTIGINDGGEEMRPIAIHRQQMSDNIEARLHGVPEHA